MNEKWFMKESKWGKGIERKGRKENERGKTTEINGEGD